MYLFPASTIQPTTIPLQLSREDNINNANSKCIIKALPARIPSFITTTLYNPLPEASDNAANSSRMAELEAEIQKLQKSMDGCEKVRSFVHSSASIYILMKFVVFPLAGCIPIVGFPLLGLQIACSILCVSALIISTGISLYSFYLLKQKESLTQEKKSIQNALDPSITETHKSREEKDSFFLNRGIYFWHCAGASFFASCSLSPLLNCVTGLPIQELITALDYITAATFTIGLGFVYKLAKAEQEPAPKQYHDGSNIA